MHYINYLFFRFWIFLIGCIPFTILYFLSDGIAWLLQNVLRYRKEVVTQNIHQSFPDKNEKQKREIASRFYRNLSDISLESLKGLSMSSSQIKKRYRFSNTEILDNLFKEGKNVVALASHYGNWEWGPMTIGSQIMHRILGIVKFVKNPYINNYISKGRAIENVFVADVSQTQKAIKQYESEPTLFVFISDQGPRNMEKAQWVNFLNQATPCLYGADRIAREKNWPVILFSTHRVKRGHYEVTIEVLEDNPSHTTDGFITKRYMAKLEQQIMKEPENWLWSHRRWKRARNYSGELL